MPHRRLPCAPRPGSIIVIDDDSPGCDDIDVVSCDDQPTTITTPAAPAKEKKQRMVAVMSTSGGRRRKRGKSLTLTLTILMRNCVLI